MNQLLKLQNKNDKQILSYHYKKIQDVDDVILQLLNEADVEGFARNSLDKAAGNVNYDITGCLSLASLNRPLIPAPAAGALVRNLYQLLAYLEDSFIDVEYAVFDMDYVFLDPVTKKLYLIVLPCQEALESTADLAQCLERMITCFTYDEKTDGERVEQVLARLRKGIRSLGELRDIAASLSEGQALSEEEWLEEWVVAPGPSREDPVKPEQADKPEKTEQSGKPGKADKLGVMERLNWRKRAKAEEELTILDLHALDPEPAGGTTPGEQRTPEPAEDTRQAEAMAVTADTLSADTLPVMPVVSETGSDAGADSEGAQTQEPKEALHEETTDDLCAALRAKVTEEVREALRAEVTEEIRASLRAEVTEEVREALRAQVTAEVREALREEVAAEMREEIRAELQAEASEELTPAVQEEKMPYLIRRKTGEVIQLNKHTFIIGKMEDCCDYVIRKNNAISRLHAIIRYREGSEDYFIVDCNSTNHIYLNGKQIPAEQAVPLENGMHIHLALEEFVFQIRG